MLKNSLLLILSCFILIVASGNDSNYVEKTMLVKLRKIGHDILAKSGDSTSTLIPTQISKNEYQIRFNGDFSFDPAWLTKIVIKELKDERQAFLVDVTRCDSSIAMYQFFYHNEEDSMGVPCAGRIYEKACYVIGIEFRTVQTKTGQNLAVNKSELNINFWLYLFLFIAILVSAYWVNKFKRGKQKNTVDHQSIIKLGKYEFLPKMLSLKFENEEAQTLTSKESKLLEQLHTNLGEIIEKETLLEKVWEDQGDYVGRTLDVYISKLRKKLEKDETVKILNHRGVGYQLIIDDLNQT